MTMRTKKNRLIALALMVVLTVSLLGMTSFASSINPRMQYCYVNTSDGSNLNGRSGPGTEYSVICQYANGTSLTWSVFPENNATDSQGRSWMCVNGRTTTGENKTAWVCEEYLRFENDYRSVYDINDVISNPELPPVG